MNKAAKQLLEDARLVLLEKAIEEDRDDRWYDDASECLYYYFYPMRYDQKSKAVEDILAGADPVSIVSDFLRDCPDLKFFRDDMRDWMDQQLDAFRQYRHQTIQRVNDALSLEKIEQYLDKFAPGYVLGAGRKPGKSFLIRYLEKTCQTKIDVWTSNQSLSIILFPDDGLYRMAPSREIGDLLLILGVDPCVDARFDKRSLRCTCGDVRKAIEEIYGYNNR